MRYQNIMVVENLLDSAAIQEVIKISTRHFIPQVGASRRAHRRRTRNALSAKQDQRSLCSMPYAWSQNHVIDPNFGIYAAARRPL